MRKKYISIQFLNTGAKLLATRGPIITLFSDTPFFYLSFFNRIVYTTQNTE
jgi:hypothetical protein